MNENTTTITLSLSRLQDGTGCYCWRNQNGARVSRYFRTETEALRYKPGYPRR